jgi:GDPmannose 4,6-dehydratase
LAELLLEKGYEVHAMIRRSSVFTTQRIDHIYDKHERLFIYHGDLTDSSNLHSLISKIKPDEVYNLAAQSHVGVSFDVPEYTGEVDAIGTIRLLDAIRDTGLNTKFYQASSSEMFGKVMETPQTEETPFYPRSPYGVAKVFSHFITMNYRESYNIFACCGILFNHESPLRGNEFVTKKISKAIAKIKKGQQEKLVLGNLDSKRDWGFAGDYVEAMHLMLQVDKPDDYVVSTGETHSVREFVEVTLNHAGISFEWSGEGVDTVAIDKDTGKEIVVCSKDFYRPAEIDLLLGNSRKAREELGWEPKIELTEGLANAYHWYLKNLETFVDLR